jgi:NADH-quinone oxidoreductase subunit G
MLEHLAELAFDVPEAGGPAVNLDEGLHLLPRPRIFGSEALSARSPGVSELLPAAYLELSPADARGLGVEPNGRVRLSGSETLFTVRIDPHLVSGCAAYAPGLKGCEDLRPGLCVEVEVVHATAPQTIAREGGAS